MRYVLKKRVLPCVIALSLSATASAESFVVQDIRIEGLQRVSAGTVFSYLPIVPGDRFDTDYSDETISALYDANLFSNIQIARDGSNTLVVIVNELPVIAEVNINGNKDLKRDNILEALDSVGFSEGQSFNPATLKYLTQELSEQYQARSKYAAQITPTVRELPRGRVAIDIDIAEGRSARIKEIDIVGNKVYSDDRLLTYFDTTTSKWNSFLTKNDQYDRDRLQADIDRLENFYLDRGFLEFKVTSSQVSLSPDKQSIYLTINVDEGQAYQIGDYQITGNLIVPVEELDTLVAFEQGDIYNRSKVVATKEAFQTRLADEGYAQTDVQIVPKVDRLTGVVDFNFVVMPGEKTYVRHIEFSGNEKTYDSVLRRELRQTEAAPYSSSDIARSEERLRRLPQVANIQQQIIPVPGEPDAVDIEYEIEERRTSYIQVGVGYGEASGALFNIDYADNNFFGTGNRFAAKFGKSQNAETYGLSFIDPYFTEDGVSIEYEFQFNKFEYDDTDLSDWALDSYSALVTFGYPLTEYQNIHFGGGYRGLKIYTGRYVADEIQDYVNKNGEKYHEGVITLSWSKDTTDNAFMPTTGSLNKIYGEVTIPGSDDTYYKTGYRNRTYFSNANNSLIFGLRGDVSYGDGYGDTESLPFYRHYYAGGISTVRGYEFGSLGPKYQNGDKEGGDFRTVGGVELAMPWSVSERTDNLRFGAFVDFGNVYESIGDFDAGEFRYSTGLFVRWLSPVGPLNISYAIPLNDEEGDETESFQFTIGAGF